MYRIRNKTHAVGCLRDIDISSLVCGGGAQARKRSSRSSPEIVKGRSGSRGRGGGMGMVDVRMTDIRANETRFPGDIRRT